MAMMAQAQLSSRQMSLEERNSLVSAHMPEVRRIVQRIAVHLPASVDIEDLIHVGVIGLIQAIERFDPERDNKFMTFAAFRIRGAVLSELRARDYLSRASRRRVRELDRASVRLEHVLGRAPEDRELAAELGVDLETVNELKQLGGIAFISLDELSPGSEEREQMIDALIYSDGEGDGLSQARLKELRAGLAKAIAGLNAKEQMVLSLYYEQELTMKEAGRVLDLTESRVSQIHSQAVARLRQSLIRQELI